MLKIIALSGVLIRHNITQGRWNENDLKSDLIRL